MMSVPSCSQTCWPAAACLPVPLIPAKMVDAAMVNGPWKRPRQVGGQRVVAAALQPNVADFRHRDARPVTCAGGHHDVRCIS
jgi:hypothetical protein